MAIVRSLTCLLSVSVLSLAAIAQQPQAVVPATVSGPLRLNVVVAQHSGAPVADLPQSAFTVLDNGKPQPIQSFRAITGRADATKVMLVVDSVNIPFIQLAYERNQIDSFLKSNDGKLAQPTSIAVVSDTSTDATEFSSDGNQLSQTLAQKEIGLRDLRRSSGFYGAEERLETSLKALQMILSRVSSMPGRKIIVWVSPGWPYLSGPNVQLTVNQENAIFKDVVAMANMMRRGDITLYSVDPLGALQGPGRTFYYEEFLKGVRKPSQVLPGDLALQVLAVQSGGLALNSSNDVRALIQRCIDDSKAFYEITYAPPPSDAPVEYHKVDVKVAVPNVTAHTVQGYYSGH